MRLSELLIGLEVVNDVEVTQLTLDSSDVVSGSVFFALAGSHHHGLHFAEQVLEQGAVAIIYDPTQWGAKLAEGLADFNLIAVHSLSEQLGAIVARFYTDPSSYLHVIGITGTNGKTSCSQFLAQALKPCGVIGTLGWGVYPNLQRTSNTTPDALTVQKILAQFVNQAIENVAIEVSSHGLEQGRVNAIKFSGAVFNNLSRDHLDYHGTMENYFQAKLALFRWPTLKFAVVNLDDAYAERVLEVISPKVKVVTYSLLNGRYQYGHTIYVQNINYSLQGICCDVTWQSQQEKLQISVLGEFNLQNVLSVLGCLLAQDKSLQECVKLMQGIKSIDGRMECFGGQDGKPLVVVDYAHTPDALAKVLHTLRAHCSAKLKLVFGCGGDRDKGKRAQMGKIAEQLADDIIITDDNPRFESSGEIIAQIMSGVKSVNVQIIHDRQAAIQQSIASSSAEDIILIAGKGHEAYQAIQGKNWPFSDRTIVNEVLAL